MKGLNNKCIYYCDHMNQKCGGCDLLKLSYNDQLKDKQKYLEQLFSGLCDVSPIIYPQNFLNYRHKVTASFALKNNRVILGIYEKHSHNVIDTCDCILQSEIANKILVELKKLVKKHHLTVYDSHKHAGLLKHVVIRVSNNSKNAMVTIVTHDNIFPGSKNLIKELVNNVPEITTVVQNVNPQDSVVVLGPYERVLFGNGHIYDLIGELSFRISSSAFYQVNPESTLMLYNKAIELSGLKSTDTFIDAYSGTGTIGIYATSLSQAKGICVELNKNAVSDAIQNAKYNKISNVKFVCKDAGLYMSELSKQNYKCDVVFTDPPRTGCSIEFINSLMHLSPKKIVYISCNPETQVRDIKQILATNKYRIITCCPVDMFPFTRHVETIVLLSHI